MDAAMLEDIGSGQDSPNREDVAVPLPASQESDDVESKVETDPEAAPSERLRKLGAYQYLANLTTPQPTGKGNKKKKKEDATPSITAMKWFELVGEDFRMPDDDKTGYYFEPRDCLWKKCKRDQMVTRLQALVDSICIDQAWPNLWHSRKACTDLFVLMVYHIQQASEGFTVNLAFPDHVPIKGNLVINLRDGKAYPRTRKNLFSAEYNVTYDEKYLRSAHALHRDYSPDLERRLFPLVHRFFTTGFCNDTEQIPYYQSVLAYIALTGLTTEKFAFWFVSLGAHGGKSKQSNWIQNMQGQVFGAAVNKIAILKATEQRGAVTHERNAFETCRTGIVSEVGAEDKIDWEFVKNVRGCDRIWLRGIYASGKMSSTSAKIVILSNHYPNIDTSDEASVEAVVTVPFKAKFLYPEECEKYKKSSEYRDLKKEAKYPNAEFAFVRDETFIEECLKSHNELFYWLVCGALRFFNEWGGSIRFHPSWLSQKRRLVEDQDSARVYLSEEWKETDDWQRLEPRFRPRVYKTELYQQYSNWMKAQVGRTWTTASRTDFERAVQSQFPSVQEVEISRKKYFVGMEHANQPVAAELVTGNARDDYSSSSTGFSDWRPNPKR
jgi:phage/plasmid-associated DNA primase